MDKPPKIELELSREREIRNLKEENKRLHQALTSMENELQYYRRLEETINRAKGNNWLFEFARQIENGFKYS